LHFHSFSFGAVSLQEAFTPNPRQTKAELEALRRHVRQVLQLEKTLAVAAQSRQLVGLGGTVTTLAALAQELNSFANGCVHGFNLLKEEIDVIAQKLSCCTPAERARLLPFAPRRADIITAGAAALSAILQFLSKDSLHVSEQGLLHGILRELC
jgi:exopolyphosphatase / guanosine-5'-triphosphate,3'-diphosphate pyrophosphatase